MAKKYKVWIQVEQVDDENDDYQNVTEPECIGTFNHQKDAELFANHVEKMASLLDEIITECMD